MGSRRSPSGTVKRVQPAATPQTAVAILMKVRCPAGGGVGANGRILVTLCMPHLARGVSSELYHHERHSVDDRHRRRRHFRCSAHCRRLLSLLWCSRRRLRATELSKGDQEVKNGDHPPRCFCAAAAASVLLLFGCRRCPPGARRLACGDALLMIPATPAAAYLLGSCPYYLQQQDRKGDAVKRTPTTKRKRLGGPAYDAASRCCCCKRKLPSFPFRRFGKFEDAAGGRSRRTFLGGAATRRRERVRAGRLLMMFL